MTGILKEHSVRGKVRHQMRQNLCTTSTCMRFGYALNVLKINRVKHDTGNLRYSFICYEEIIQLLII